MYTCASWSWLTACYGRPLQSSEMRFTTVVSAVGLGASCAGWLAALLLLYKWWSQLQGKASSHDSESLLEDDADSQPSSQYGFVSATEHHSRHHPTAHGHHAAGGAGLLEQQDSGLEGSDRSQGSRGSTSSRGVLPGLSQRRRPPSSAITPLLGQCRSMYCAALLVSPACELAPLQQGASEAEARWYKAA